MINSNSKSLHLIGLLSFSPMITPWSPGLSLSIISITFSTEPFKTENMICSGCFLGSPDRHPLLEMKRKHLLGGSGRRKDALPTPSQLWKKHKIIFCLPIQIRVLSTLLYLNLCWQADLYGLHQMSSLALWLPVEYGQWDAPARGLVVCLPGNGVAVAVFLYHRPQLPSGGPLPQLELLQFQQWFRPQTPSGLEVAAAPWGCFTFPYLFPLALPTQS